MSNRTPRTVPEFRRAYKRLFDAGSLRIEKAEIIGKASDGVEVVIGNTLDATGVAVASRYLEDHPNQDQW